MATQTFLRRARLGVRERLRRLAQEQRGREPGMAFLDGTSIRAHPGPGGLPGFLPGTPMRTVADRGCSSHALRAMIRDLGATPAIPTRKNDASAAPVGPGPMSIAGGASGRGRA